MGKWLKDISRLAETRICVGFMILFSVLTYFGFFESLEVKTIDFRFRNSGRTTQDDGIVIVEISDNCLNELGQWPWPRGFHARALNILASAGATAVGFDMIFDNPSTSDVNGDLELVKSCQAFSKTIFSMAFSLVTSFDPITSLTRTESVCFKPFPALASCAGRLGLINLDFQSVNPDGIIRRFFLSTDVGSDSYPSFPMAIAQNVIGEKLSIKDDRVFLNGGEVPLVDTPEWTYSPDGWKFGFKKTFPINFLGASTSGIFPRVPFADVLSGQADPAKFKGKIVLIGPGAISLGDLKLTPFGEMPGVWIHANVVQNLIRGNFLRHTSFGMNVIFMFILSVGSVLILAFTRSLSGMLWGLLVLLTFNYLAFFSFQKYQLALQVVPQTLLMMTQIVSCRFWQMFVRLRMAYQSLKERTIDLEKANATLDCRIQELLVINEAGSRFPSILDLEHLSHEILNTLCRLWNAEIAHIFSYDPDNDRFVLIAKHNHNESTQLADAAERFVSVAASAPALTGGGNAPEKHPSTSFFEEGISDPDSEKILLNPRVSGNLRRLVEERTLIMDPQGEWFSVYLPLMVGPRLWGGIFLKQRNTGDVRKEGDKFWMTLLGMATTALENAKLYHLATVDSLTRLFVRRYFKMQLERELKRAIRYQHPVSLLMTDIDHFKKFNDTYGHQQGDIVLREVASVVKASLRDVDIPARYGGEEFAIVLPQTELEGAIIVAERIRGEVERLEVPRFNKSSETLHVTLSLGVASYPSCQIENPEEMVKLADEALYKAKAGGRNRVENAPADQILKSEH